MAPPKVVHGARAIVQLVDPNTGVGSNVGIFDNCSYSLTYDVQPAFILGRFSAAELGYTAQEPVPITCSGWRVISAGPHQLPGNGMMGGVPHLQDLLMNDYISLQVVDRQSGKPIATFSSVRATGYSTTIQARQLETVTVNFTGLLVDDESGDNTESPPAADLP